MLSAVILSIACCIQVILLSAIYRELKHIRVLLLEEADEREYDRQARYLNNG